MKRILFTLMMIAALAMVANTAKALNDKEVYAGGTYSYQLNGIVVNTTGTATIVYTNNGTSTGNVTVSNLSGGFGGTAPAAITAATGASTFDLTFAALVAQGAGTLQVTITDGAAANACANFIEFGITVLPPPTYQLALTVLTTGYEVCQARTGVAENAPDALGTNIAGEVNTLSFTVTPTIAGIITDSSYTYNYTLSISDLNAALNSYDIASTDVSITNLATIGAGEKYAHTQTIVPTSLTGDVFTVTFNTTTGIAVQDIVAAITTGATFSELTVTGGVVVQATIPGTNLGTETVKVGAVPTIGSFGL